MSRNSQLLQNAVRMQAIATANLRSHPKIGTISGYDQSKHAVKVELQPAGNETGWIPLGALWVGNGWGMFCAPSLGTQVEVTFVDGNQEAGSANLRFFSNVEGALPAPSGEFWLVHKSGQSVKLTNDGKLTIDDAHGATVTLDGAGNIASQAKQWTHAGPVHFTDNVQVDKTLTANTDVIGGGISLKNHKTTLVQPGTGQSGPPV
jgi:phage baseplate assembly protein V